MFRVVAVLGYSTKGHISDMENNYPTVGLLVFSCI
uniref:Uncharacterized protein n=1 Tax=Anguilla anguilla TaxID=7936 RepID=A0A0E9QCT3_ANGAN